MTLVEPPQTAPRKTTMRPRWRLRRLPLFVAIVGLLGASMLLYPSAASWVSSAQQAASVDEYLSTVEAIGPIERTDALAAAAAYNDQLTTGGASIPANERLPLADDTTAIPGYLDQLDADDSGLMAHIRIPAIGVDLPIYHGTSDSVLRKGVGHLEGTALPIGGAGTHAVMTGHRGLASAELFTRLDELTEGDTFTIEVFGEVLTYRIISTQVVEPDQTETLHPVAGQDLVTLVTCTPLVINSHRILVTAERVLPTPPKDLAGAGSGAAGPGFPWWTGGGALVIALLTGYMWRSGRPSVMTPCTAGSAAAKRSNNWWRSSRLMAQGPTPSAGAVQPVARIQPARSSVAGSIARTTARSDGCSAHSAN